MMFKLWALALLLASAVAAPAPSNATPSGVGSSVNPDYFSDAAPYKVTPITKDDDFNFNLQLGLDLSRGGGSGPNDILAAASYIKPGDMESFASAFWALANQTLAEAQKIDNTGSNSRSTRITSRDSYLAASTYYQLADFYLHGNPSDPRLKSMWAAQSFAFREGLKGLTGMTAEHFSIPTKHGFVIPGYYYRIDSRRRPTLIITTGYDGPQEQFLTWLGPLIIDHGWNFITYEGPGQPTVIHEQSVPFRPDWEVVMSPVIDWLEKQPTADLSYLTSIGMSLGGYLAARAAAYEPRVKAQILNGGIFDVFAAFTAKFGPLLEYLGKNNTLFDELVEKYVLKNSSSPTGARWGVQQGLYTFGTRSPSEWLLKCKAYNSKDWVHRINIPTFIVNATEDAFFPNQSIEMADALRENHVPVTLQTMGGIAAMHDQVGASLELNRKMWPWLNSIWPNCPSFE